jgi:uncharacterized protein YjbJ (UPF0337 family)
MDMGTLKGNWNQIKGEVKARWGKLTDDDLTEIAGEGDKLIGALQKKYGYSKDKAEVEYKSFIDDKNYSVYIEEKYK